MRQNNMRLDSAQLLLFPTMFDLRYKLPRTNVGSILFLPNRDCM